MMYARGLIGKHIVINGNTGEIIDETKHLITVQHAHRVRTYQKPAVSFTLPQEKIIINGCDIVARPEDRIQHNGKKHRHGNQGKSN